MESDPAVPYEPHAPTDDARGPGTVRRAGTLRVDLAGHQAAIGERTVELSHLQFQLLVALVERCDRVVGYRELTLAGWGVPGDRRRELRNAASRLRRLIGDEPGAPRIEAVPGVGYVLRLPGGDLPH